MAIKKLTVYKNRFSNFITGLLCHHVMPLTPFIFQYIYSTPHQISMRSVTLAASTYCFSASLELSSGSYSLITIIVGFILSGLYGSYKAEEISNYGEISCIIIYVIFAIGAWNVLQAFYENEICQFYKKFVE